MSPLPFGVVMTGIGVIALAGVVVNNNIVLIATYDQLRHEGMDKIEAILETCRERARPVVLTALTAIFGVLPIAFGLNLELLSHDLKPWNPLQVLFPLCRVHVVPEQVDRCRTFQIGKIQRSITGVSARVQNFRIVAQA